jgi:hypothetical protein
VGGVFAYLYTAHKAISTKPVNIVNCGTIIQFFDKIILFPDSLVTYPPIGLSIYLKCARGCNYEPIEG